MTKRDVVFLALTFMFAVVACGWVAFTWKF